jgi:hypothetical protein
MATGYQVFDRGLFITGLADGDQEQAFDFGLFFDDAGAQPSGITDHDRNI